MRGEIAPPGDKSLSHRVAMLCGIAQGVSEIRGYLQSGDCMHTLQAMQTLGARADWRGEVLFVTGNNGRMIPPAGPVDMGNSGTGLRLLAGLVAGRPLDVTLTGDESLCSRPMGRIKEPLERMGAALDLTGPKGCAPVRIRGGALNGIRYDLPVASAQVKSCILLATLFAQGETELVERLPTRDHTERLMNAMGVPVRTDGLTVRMAGQGAGGPALKAARWRVPGDFSSAAFWLVAAAAFPGAEVTVRGVGLNPRRTALLDVLRRMGAVLEIRPDTEGDFCEPAGDIHVRGGPLRGCRIGGAEIPNLIDELPILAVAGALASGETRITDAAELRVKESDRIATMAAGLREMGVDVEEQPDGMRIAGGAEPRASDRLQSRGDHRIAMALAVLALFAKGDSTVNDVACVDTSYPGFWADLRRLSGD
jgi:3-phosphoshikimate 1-carboxyvinyltransferase